MWLCNVGECGFELAVIPRCSEVEQLIIGFDPIGPLHHNQHATVLTCREVRALESPPFSERSTTGDADWEVNIGQLPQQLQRNIDNRIGQAPPVLQTELSNRQTIGWQIKIKAQHVR